MDFFGEVWFGLGSAVRFGKTAVFIKMVSTTSAVSSISLIRVDTHLCTPRDIQHYTAAVVQVPGIFMAAWYASYTENYNLDLMRTN